MGVVAGGGVASTDGVDDAAALVAGADVGGADVTGATGALVVTDGLAAGGVGEGVMLAEVEAATGTGAGVVPGEAGEQAARAIVVTDTTMVLFIHCTPPP